jgi:hypothetical protein
MQRRASPAIVATFWGCGCRQAAGGSQSEWVRTKRTLNGLSCVWGNGFSFWGKLRLLAPSQHKDMHAMRPAAVCVNSHVALTLVWGGGAVTSVPGPVSVSVSRAEHWRLFRLRATRVAVPPTIWARTGITNSLYSSQQSLCLKTRRPLFCSR